MPKTKFQDFIFTIIMVIVMVYAMVCYNISINIGGMSNKVFIMALGELPIMGAIAFLLEFLLIGHITKKIAFNMVNPKETKPILMIIIISSLTVCFMCPLMSFFATVLFNYSGIGNLLANWFEITVKNFPMALCWQIFYAGPFVRFIFRKIFKEN
ncbi:MAG: DUF2798 domain-containing protein [Clostridium sp.]|nr:DUF2798 domain-containing protein [Clostridium sp.]